MAHFTLTVNGQRRTVDVAPDTPLLWVRGSVKQTNLVDYPLLRMREMPIVETYIVSSTASPTGVGEPPVPPVAPAITNAVRAATGTPVRSLPIRVAPAVQAGRRRP